MLQFVSQILRPASMPGWANAVTDSNVAIAKMLSVVMSVLLLRKRSRWRARLTIRRETHVAAPSCHLVKEHDLRARHGVLLCARIELIVSILRRAGRKELIVTMLDRINCNEIEEVTWAINSENLQELISGKF
jgi:hypothetical protein